MGINVAFEGRVLTHVGTTFVIGRDRGCDLQIKDPRVSRRHLILECPDGNWLVRDLGSANGIYVDGQRVTEHPLSASQVLVLGTDPDSAQISVDVVQDFGVTESMTQMRPVSRPSAAPQVAAAHETVVATIGRDPSNTVQVADLLVSRFHAQVIQSEQGLRVQDLNSRNGTYVNGAPISSVPFVPGDLLTVGRHHFRMQGDQLVQRVDEGRVSLAVDGLSFTIPSGKTLLSDVGFTLSPSSLTGVIGPSGAGKSTLFRILSGGERPSSGVIGYDGRDLYANLAELQHRMGVVPQDDLVHSGLTVRQALTYAAELRFPTDTRADERAARVAETMEELGLTAHADTRVSRLSGGQRKRTSVAMELLTRPSLLFLDEPTSGLDPGLDKQVMLTLRQLADGGRTVLVVTHAVANLAVCDNVLLLAPGGRIAYFGAPAGLLPFMGRSDFADVFADLADDPDGAAQRYAQSKPPSGDAPRPTPAEGAPERPGQRPEIPRQGRARQISTLIRRQLRVLAADRSYAAFTLVLPAVLALLTLTVPGSSGWKPQNTRFPTSEPMQLLNILIVGAAFMGTTTSVKELIGERAIFRRERGVGLSPGTYLLSKVLIFAAISVIQAAILTGLVLLRKPAATTTALFSSAAIELWVVVSLTTFAGCLLGLVVSAWVTSMDQVMPLLVASVMAQLVLCGGLIPITGRAVLDELSWLMPGRWGYAAAASSTNLVQLMPGVSDDELWKHDTRTFVINLAALVAVGIGCIVITSFRLWRDGRRR